MIDFYLFLATHSIVCSNPEELIGDSVTISGYTPPAVEGTMITFYCSPGAVLDGIISSTCMENGEWEPAPFEIRCLGTYLIIIIIVQRKFNNTLVHKA